MLRSSRASGDALYCDKVNLETIRALISHLLSSPFSFGFAEMAVLYVASRRKCTILHALLSLYPTCFSSQLRLGFMHHM